MHLSASKPNKNSTLPQKKDGLINLIPIDNIVSMPETDSRGILCVSDFVLVDEDDIQVLYLTPSTQKYQINSDGDAESRLFKKKIFGNYPGNELQIFEFIKENINRPFVAVYKECGGNIKIFGSKSNPLFLNPNYNDDKDKKSYEVNLEQNSVDNIPILFYVYNGEPAGTFILDGIGSSGLQGIPLGFIYLKTEEPTPEELAKYKLPVSFRICVDGKFTEVTYDSDGNRFEGSSGSGSIKNFPTFADFLIPGDIATIYKALDTDELFIWDAETGTYLLSSIDNAWKNYVEISIGGLQTSIDGINSELVVVEARLDDLAGNDDSLQAQISDEITARQNADIAEYNARVFADGFKLDKPTAPNNTSDRLITGDGGTTARSNYQRNKQYFITLPATVSEDWKGCMVFFTSSGNLTVPTGLTADFTFNGIVDSGVSLTPQITTPMAWLGTTPAPFSGVAIFTMLRRDGTNNFQIVGI